MDFRLNKRKEHIDVLYLDDNESHQKILTRNIKEIDPSIVLHTVQNGADAISTLRDLDIDCILCDYSLPGRNGIEQGKDFTKVKQVPMILYTGQGSESVASLAFDAGFNDYVVKDFIPDSVQVLVQRIRSLVLSDWARQEISEKEQLYQLLFENIQEGLWVFDSEHNTQYVSPQLASMLGYTVEEMLQMSFYDFIPPENHEFMKSKFRERRKGIKDVYDSQYLHKDGHIISVLIATTPILDHNQEYNGVIAGVLDLTEYDELRTKLKETETLWRAVIENAPIIIASVTPDYRINFINRQVYREVYDVLDRSIEEFLDDQSIELTKENLQKVFQDKVFVTFQTRVIRSDGSVVWYENKVAPIIVQGEVIQALYISDDITRKKLFENELKVIKSISELFLSKQTLNNIYAEIPKILVENFSFAQGAIEKYDPENNTMVFLGTFGFPHKDSRIVVPVDETISGIVVSTGKPVVTDESDKHPLYLSPELKPLGAKTFVSLPLMLQGKVFGVLSLASPTSFEVWPELLETLEIIGYHLSLELDRRLIEEELQTSQDRLNNFFSSATENFLLLDANMVIEKANSGFVYQTGQEESDILGKHLLDVYPDLESTGRYDAYLHVIETGEPVFFDNIDTFSVHGRRIINIHAFKVGEGLGLISNDVTSRNLYEERLEVLLQHASGLVEAESFEEIAEITLEAINATLETSIVTFHIVDEGIISPILSSNPNVSRSFKIELDGPGVIARALRLGETQLIPDTSQDPDYLSLPVELGLSHKSELTIPIFIDKKPYAAINLESERINAFTLYDKTLLELLVEHVSTNIVRILETEQRVKYETQLEALARFSSLLNQSTSLVDISEIVVDAIHSVLGFDYGGVAFIEGDHLVPGKRLGKDSDLPFRKISEHGVVKRAIDSGRIQVVQDTRKDTDYVAYPPSIINKSELVVPIIRDDEVIGVIDIESKYLDAFSSRDIRLMELFAENISASVIALDRFSQTQYLEERWRTFLESSKDAIAVFQDTKIVYANQSYADLVGFDSSQDAIGVELSTLIPDDIQSDIIGLTRRRQAGETGPERYESLVKHLDGHLIDIEVVANLTEFDGKPAALSFVRDITQRKQAEKRLEQERKRAQQYLDLTGAIIVSLDKVGDIVLINEYGANLLEYTVEELVGENWFDLFIDEQNREAVYNVFLQTLVDNQLVESYENSVITRSGEPRTILWYNTYVQGDHGEITGTLSSGVDVTGIREAEKIRERELEVTTALSELYTPLIKADSSLREITDILYQLSTRLTESEIGYIATVDQETNDLINHSLQFSVNICKIDPSLETFKFPSNPDRSYRGLWGYCLKELNPFYTNNASTHPASIGVPEGHMKLTRYLSVPVTLEDELVGQIALANSSRDYTDHDLHVIGRLAEFYSLAIQRRRIEELYRTVVENSTNGISILDENLGLLYANNRYLEIFGYTWEELRGRSVLERIHPDERNQISIQGKNRLKGLPSPTSYEVKGIHKNGSVLELEVATTSVEYLGKRATLNFLADVTESREVMRELERERIKLEQAEEMDELKTQFIGTATHELRTPVTAIKGYLELLKVGAFGNIPENIGEIIDIVDRNSERLSRLTDDLLDMQRIESGRLTINKAPLDVKNVFDQILEEMQPHFAEKNQKISVSIPRDLPLIEFDEIRVSQVIYNLMSNASKFSPEDSTIKVKASRTPSGVHFQVIDQGIGLSSEDINRVFQPFANIKKEKHVTGTGLGLSITKGIIELHGGQIWVESDGRNKGASIHFTLPYSS